MSSPCAAAPEDSSSASGSPSPPLRPSLTARGTPLRLKSWQRAWKTGRWRRLQSSLTSTRFPLGYLPAVLTAWPPDSPVSRTRLPATAAASTTIDGCGDRSGASFARFDPRSCSWRTCQASLPLEGLIESSPIWPRAGGLRNGTAFLRQPSAPHISVTDSFCWRAQIGTATRTTLLLPTPTASDHKRGAGKDDRDDRKNGMTLTSEVTDGAAGLRLNPAFAEWMMGWPLNWTVTVYTSSETASSPKLRRGRGEPCGNDS